MKKLCLIFILPFMLGGAFEIIPALPDLSAQAEAARLGGGRSFGSRPSLNRSAPAPAPARQGMQQQNAAGAAGAPARGGFMGGMLGPLLAGSLLGALFFGGAFSGLGMIDIVMIGLLVWMALRLLRGRRPAPQRQGGHGGSGGAQNHDYSDAWAHLRDTSSGPARAAAAGYASSGFTPPPGFDHDKFMEGARLMYSRMQEAWDRRDLADIRQFTTPGMYRLIEEQAKEDPTPSSTTILTMQAQLHEFRREGEEEFISVYFDALLREYADRDAENAREIWHFARKTGGTWKLDGIQQVE